MRCKRPPCHLQGSPTRGSRAGGWGAQALGGNDGSGREARPPTGEAPEKRVEATGMAAWARGAGVGAGPGVGGGSRRSERTRGAGREEGRGSDTGGVRSQGGGARPETQQSPGVGCGGGRAGRGPPTAPEGAPCPHHCNRECPSSSSSAAAGPSRRASRPGPRPRGPRAAAPAAGRRHRAGRPPRGASWRPPSSPLLPPHRACASLWPRPRTPLSGSQIFPEPSAPPRTPLSGSRTCPETPAPPSERPFPEAGPAPASLHASSRPRPPEAR